MQQARDPSSLVAAIGLALCLSAGATWSSGAQAPDLRYLAPAAVPVDAALQFVDSRPESDCLGGSVAGAVCLPAGAFFGPHGRLASARDISWILGCAGLGGDESVLVFGPDPVRRDAVAALLYLAGQSRVTVLDGSLEDLFAHGGLVPAPGRARGILRDPIHVGPWRDDLILLRDELADALAQGRVDRLLDGRASDEYWGERIRARRGGHIPGAQSAPAVELRAALADGEAGLAAATPVVAYAQDPLAGLAYLTLLRAGLRLDATLYVGGWREWADHGRLPVDAVSYAPVDLLTQTVSNPIAPNENARDKNDQNDNVPGRTTVLPTSALARSLLTLAAIVAAGGFGYLLGRRTVQ